MALKTSKKKSIPARYRDGFLKGLDKRSTEGRRLSSIYEDVVADAGGFDAIPKTKLALIQRFVWLMTMMQRWERQMAMSKKSSIADAGKWVQALNALSGLSKQIGLKRYAKPFDLESLTTKER